MVAVAVETTVATVWGREHQMQGSGEGNGTRQGLVVQRRAHLVNAHDDHGGVVLGGGREDNLLCPGGEVGLDLCGETRGYLGSVPPLSTTTAAKDQAFI